MIMGLVVRGTAVRCPTERSISVFTDLIQCRLFKLADQGEIRLYFLGMDLCLVLEQKRMGAEGGAGCLQGPTPISYLGNQKDLPFIDYSIFSQIMLFSSLLKDLTCY